MVGLYTDDARRKLPRRKGGWKFSKATIFEQDRKNAMIGYKGFNSKFGCQDMQYEVGKTFEHPGNVELFKAGLHFCESPLDVFGYYDPTNSRYASVEADGVDGEKNGG